MTYKIEFDSRVESKIKKLDKHERALLFKVLEKIIVEVAHRESSYRR